MESIKRSTLGNLYSLLSIWCLLSCMLTKDIGQLQILHQPEKNTTVQPKSTIILPLQNGQAHSMSSKPTVPPHMCWTYSGVMPTRSIEQDRISLSINSRRRATNCHSPFYRCFSAASDLLMGISFLLSNNNPRPFIIQLTLKSL